MLSVSSNYLYLVICVYIISGYQSTTNLEKILDDMQVEALIIHIRNFVSLLRACLMPWDLLFKCKLWHVYCVHCENF